jgi:hypothetical protein
VFFLAHFSGHFSLFTALLFLLAEVVGIFNAAALSLTLVMQLVSVGLGYLSTLSISTFQASISFFLNLFDVSDSSGF